MKLKSIMQLIKKDINIVDKIIIQHLNSDVQMINQLSDYIITGGKKIRPIVTILVGRALDCSYNDKHIHYMSAIIEFIHIATLLHDDVIDNSTLRRGKKTANNVFGNSAAILVGDFIYTKSFQMLTELNSMPILQLMSNATNIIAKGEILQLINSGNPDITESIYMQIIYSKTARLFEAATHAAAIICGANEIQQQAMQTYGRYFGNAFQLMDDYMDYSMDNNKYNKNIGNDLITGKLTLPLLHVIENSSLEESKFIKNSIKNGNTKYLLNELLLTMKRYGSLEYTNQRAQEEAKKAIKALDLLPSSLYKEALVNLVLLCIKF
uniref:Octaprenyl diphosphate synthase n=1 Tax=Candidatus Aschnera chinzeii TaxID=1485666 RepID=A0AAT9G4K9_9ENTR|nr:MAG: octaprenyl diphosphate synthase [Candidatus Aschnera chinzeii]